MLDPKIQKEASRFQGSFNLDDGESVFFARELESIKTRLYDVMYPEFKARMFCPVDDSAGPGAEAITYYQYDKVGMAKIIGDYSDDLPAADATGQKFTSPVESIGNSFRYNRQEVEASAMAGRPLRVMKAMAARRAHEQKVDEICAFGDPTTGLRGMLNHANVPVGNAVNGNWTSATPSDDVLADLNEGVETMISSTNSVESPDTLVLSPSRFTFLAQTRLTDQNTTLLEFFLRTNPWIRNVDHWYRLESAGVGGTQRMLFYRRDPSVLTLEIPKEFTQLPVQERNLAFVVPCHSRIGGVIVYRPLAMLYRDGI